jgi:hypothetical protein
VQLDPLLPTPGRGVAERGSSAGTMPIWRPIKINRLGA